MNDPSPPMPKGNKSYQRDHRIKLLFELGKYELWQNPNNRHITIGNTDLSKIRM
jgi:hypothetical protein